MSATFSIPAVTWTGPEINEWALLEALPVPLGGVLRQNNGFIACAGGFHFRGICSMPDWHSLQGAMAGPRAIYRLFPNVRSTDVPFAQDCYGDQFLYREFKVWQLDAENGTLHNLNLTLKEFFGALATRPVEFLGLQPLVSFQEQGHKLAPDQSLLCWPPVASRQSDAGLTVKAVGRNQHLEFLSHVARQMSQVKPGETFEFQLPAGVASPLQSPTPPPAA